MKTEAVEKLNEDQVHELLVEYMDTKDVEVRDKIVLQYKNLVESIARRFAGSGEPFEDLTQEGYIGLITATDLYDIEKGVKFSTYATHFIIGQIKHALRDRGKIIKEPAWLQELNHRMTRVIDALCQELGRQPTSAEVGKVMHLPEQTVAEMLTTREIFKVASLDYDQEDIAVGGMDVDKLKNEKFTTFSLPLEDRIVLEMSVNKLKIIEQKVINEFYFTGLSQTEIAKKLGISCNYVSHILRSGTRKLRRILTTEEIRDVQIQLQLASRRSEDIVVETHATVVDSLTGLYDSRYMQDRLQEEVNRAVRNKTEIAFAIIAIPELEEYGKQHGNGRLDNILYELARIIRDTVRKCDVVGRLGQCEFGLILLYTSQQADKVCERVRQAIKQVKIETGSYKEAVSLDPNIGYAVYNEDDSHAKDLIDLAMTAVTQAQDEKLQNAA